MRVREASNFSRSGETVVTSSLEKRSHANSPGSFQRANQKATKINTDRSELHQYIDLSVEIKGKNYTLKVLRHAETCWEMSSTLLEILRPLSIGVCSKSRIETTSCHGAAFLNV